MYKLGGTGGEWGGPPAVRGASAGLCPGPEPWRGAMATAQRGGMAEHVLCESSPSAA
jgi:hypothetical protein